MREDRTEATTHGSAAPVAKAPALIAGSELKERLTRLGLAQRPTTGPPSNLPRGFELLQTPHGDAVIRYDVIPLPALDPHPGSIAYVDTETTGLAGGTGTYVFAAAVARPIDCGLRVVQFFLPLPGMESSLLYALHSEITEADGLATFNGSSFDLPLLRTRWVMSRMPGDLTHPPHVDLLTLSRAMFRHRLESCTLRAVELRLLDYERDDPIPSALVPDAYFAYLRGGPDETLEMALEHNRLDVISLAHLHSRLLRRLHGRDVDMEAQDWLAVGKFRFRRGNRADGWRALRNAANFGEPGAAATAGLMLARRLVRRGLVSAADRLLEWLEACAPQDMRLAVSRARLLEWRRREPYLALAVVEAAQRRFAANAFELEPRRARLQRKAVKRLNLGKRRDRVRRRDLRHLRADQLEAPVLDSSF